MTVRRVVDVLWLELEEKNFSELHLRLLSLEPVLELDFESVGAEDFGLERLVEEFGFDFEGPLSDQWLRR